MKAFVRELLLLVVVSSCFSAPAKLSLASSPNRDHNLVGRRAYSYDPPADAASNLPDGFALAGPPPAPLFPDRSEEKFAFFSPPKRTSSSTTTTSITSTTSTTLPPPPSGLYGAPDPNTSDSEVSSFNSNFVSVGVKGNRNFRGPASG